MSVEKFLLLKTDGSFSAVDVDCSDMLHSFYRLIGPSCDCIETVYLVIGGKNFLALVDESGLFHDLQINPIASALYPGSVFGSPIVGNVILGSTGYRDGEPDIIGLSPDELRFLSSSLSILST